MVLHHCIGTAGWSVPRSAEQFPADGSGLERYAAVFSAVEINSSFYRRHRPATWQRWHDAVPQAFRFSVKLPRTITHERALAGAESELALFFEDIAPLGTKLGAVLMQLPPKLAFAPGIAEDFLAAFRSRSPVPAYIEPRHPSWADRSAGLILERHDIGRVLADPQDAALHEAARAEASPYLRLHGSPKVYYSAYTEDDITFYADLLLRSAKPGWCIFDNTASGAAISDALRLQTKLAEASA